MKQRLSLVVLCLGLMAGGVGFGQAGSSSSNQQSLQGGQNSGDGSAGQGSGGQSVTSPDTNSGNPAQNVTPPDTNSGEPAPPKGTVLFERHTEAPAVEGEEKPAEKPAAAGDKGVSSSNPGASTHPAPSEADVQVSDADREALTFLAYDLDAHVVPARAGLEMHARFTVRNDGQTALSRVAVQVSSSLEWERFTLGAGGAALQFAQHVIDTDADHTGQAQEAIVMLPGPLAAGKTVELSAFYSGKVERSAKRLEAMGAPAAEAMASDWDGIGVDETALRGFGNVLWYPVASPQVFLGDGAALFRAVGETKLKEQKATVRLRLTVEYEGDGPAAAYFCGRMEPMHGVSENMNALAVSAPGVAVAEFEARALGFRVPSLFVTTGKARLTGGMTVSAVTERDDALAVYGSAAEAVEPMLKEWIAESPVGPLNILDHVGQPFEDGTLLVAPMTDTDTSKVSAGLAHSLTHAWFESNHAWLNEGMAQFMGYLWTERTVGREVAMQGIQQEAGTLALVEPAAGKAGQSLIEARDEVYYRTKAAAVLWMLRSVAGEDALKQALHAYARETRRDGKKDEDPKEFERVLEEASHKDLAWFFADWVYADKGLPDLSIESVTPRELTVKDGRGGWMVAVVVHNAGDAAVEVPVTVRSGTLTATERIRVLGGASTSTRILFEGDPEQVIVNDGSVPEVGGSGHLKLLKKAK